MQTIFGISKIKKKYPNPVIALGVFDGLHLGHRQLIGSVVAHAKAIDGTVMVMTFDPHPVHVLRPEKKMPLIVSLPYRLKLLEQLGVDVCIVVRFTKRFAKMTPEKFIKNDLVGMIHPGEVVVGDDFRFGCNRSGTLDYFQKAAQIYGFNILAIQANVREGHKVVSSARIRECIAQGKLYQAAKLLDRPVSVFGKVVRGDGRGKGLGFPTVNINPTIEIVPPLGVYFSYVCFDGRKYPAVANVGRRPSVRKSEDVNVEAHILNFRKNVYGREIVIEFIKKIRPERKFASEEALARQIQLDVKKARAWFKK
ncbi:MAG: bifunctional riboflavin kinase/FAD synthetase [Candidatus Omnitrophica bacterium]|nr:bifunctional riboflavin kinase/FAD synthetase [Candidatus Omnitrophota bacterium]